MSFRHPAPARKAAWIAPMNLQQHRRRQQRRRPMRTPDKASRAPSTIAQRPGYLNTGNQQNHKDNVTQPPSAWQGKQLPSARLVLASHRIQPSQTSLSTRQRKRDARAPHTRAANTKPPTPYSEETSLRRSMARKAAGFAFIHSHESLDVAPPSNPAPGKKSGRLYRPCPHT